MRHSRYSGGLTFLVLAVLPLSAQTSLSLKSTTDTVTRYVHVSYHVPASAPAKVAVRGEVRLENTADWRPAAIWPYVSETALRLMPAKDWEEGILRGTLVERLAAGTVRTLVWNPFHLDMKKASVRFRVTLLDQDKILARDQLQINLDNSDVIVLDDWRKVLQPKSMLENPQPGRPVWWFRRGQRGDRAPSRGTSLEVKEKGVELPQLTYPLDLRGPYALFVSLPPKLGGIKLRLSGDERAQAFSFNFNERWLRRETFWRWADLTRQHLVIQQPYSTVYEYEDEYRAHLDTVRLVPLTARLVEELEARWSAGGEKRIVAGYNEPASWSFDEKVESNLQHREPLLAFAEARVEMVDVQFGRGGSRMFFESRVGSQLIGATMGDAVRGKVPFTPNPGRMQQYTNMLATQVKYIRQLGMKPRANLGATNCYVGSPNESEFSKQHPEWRINGRLKYEVPEVRRYILALFEEAIQIGAESLSIDWCRYPHSVTSKETVTGFFRELRALADRYERLRGRPIDILARFPARDAPGWQYMDYATWAREGLVDFLAPSRLFDRVMNFDIVEYVEAVKGTKAKLLPEVGEGEGNSPMPGMWLQRILKMYEDGADGVYIYQSDFPVLKSPETRRYVSLAGSPDALKAWRLRERAEQSRYSKGIYINQTMWDDNQYHCFERLRVWVEGFEPGLVELLVDGRLINRYHSPPYILASEELSDNDTIPPGRHLLKARAKAGQAWLEREFRVQFAPPLPGLCQ